jgi:hypothetical protein
MLSWLVRLRQGGLWFQPQKHPDLHEEQVHVISGELLTGLTNFVNGY